MATFSNRALRRNNQHSHATAYFNTYSKAMTGFIKISKLYLNLFTARTNTKTMLRKFN